MECCQSGRAYPAETEMLYEAYPGIPESVRVRTTSESTDLPANRPTRKCDLHTVPRSCQGAQCSGFEADLASKISKGNTNADTYDAGMRSRTGSKGIRDFLRLVTRSSTDENDRKVSANGKARNSTDESHGDGHVTLQQPSWLVHLKESIRPRSQSDASSIQIPRRRNPCLVDKGTTEAEKGDPDPGRFQCDVPGRNSRGRDSGTKPRHEVNALEATMTTLRISGVSLSNGDTKNPIRSPLSPFGRVKSPSHIGPAEFIELYRHRAQSDPRPQVKTVALANVRKKRLVAARLASSPAYVAMDSLQEKKLIIWKDKTEGNQLLVLPGDGSDDTEVESIKLDKRAHLTYCDLLKATKCYDIIPNSTKMVILDSQLSVKKALFALLNNGLRSAPIWDSQTQQLSGMLTVTDFILVLQRYYLTQSHSIESVEDHSISTFKAILGHTVDHLTTIKPEENLLDAILALRHHAVHRLPVIDPSTGNIIHMMTYKRLLCFIQMAISKNVASFINKTIEELKIGTYEDIAMVHPRSTVVDAMKLLIDFRVSSLPVVDSDRKLVSMFSRADVINMAAEKTYSRMDMTVGDTQNDQDMMSCVESTATCQKTDTLMSVVTKLSRREIRRLPVLDASGHVIGIVSVSDIVQFIADQTDVDSFKEPNS